MRNVLHTAALVAVLVISAGTTVSAHDNDRDDHGRHRHSDDAIQLGPRPFYLVYVLDEGPLKHRLMQCKDGPVHRTDFSIGHRGAALQLPDHTREAYEAGPRMGAWIVECDVIFTKDGHL